ncbi:MAG: RluA family pseudouridine synthase [Lentisphaerae bacterium]|nr:RluA family pseudouridine synthase [Lentisphaerota bacterium]
MLPFPAIKRVIASQFSAAEPVLLLHYLSQRFSYLDPAGWHEQLKLERLLINGSPAKAEQWLRPGDQIEFMPRTLPEPAVSWKLEQLFDDERLLVLHKPANLPCHPSGAFFNHTLWAWLKQIKKMPKPYICNRLDRESSGLLIVAKNKACARLIGEALQKPDTLRVYRVLVHGCFPSSLEAQGWLLSDTHSSVRKKMRFVACKQGKPEENAKWVHTSLQCLDYDAERDVSDLQAILHSGRTHQIRATLCSLGYPVLGDKLYGLDEGCFLRFAQGKLSTEDEKILQWPRQALHAWKIKLQLADQTTPCCFEASLPEEWPP